MNLDREAKLVTGQILEIIRTMGMVDTSNRPVRCKFYGSDYSYSLNQTQSFLLSRLHLENNVMFLALYRLVLASKQTASLWPPVASMSGRDWGHMRR